MEKTPFELMCCTYYQQGDYLLPGLSTAPQEEQSIGVWGRRRKQYLKEHHRVLYYNLLTSGKLQADLADVEEQAQEMFERLTKQMTEKQGVTEALKAADMMAWVGRMNNIRQCVTEIVLEEILSI